MGRSQYRFCPAGSDPFGGMCAEQGKPQHNQYCINCNQRFLSAADGGNCCACHVPYFRSVRKQVMRARVSLLACKFMYYGCCRIRKIKRFQTPFAITQTNAFTQSYDDLQGHGSRLEVNLPCLVCFSKFA